MAGEADREGGVVKPARDHGHEIKLSVARKQIREYADAWGVSISAAADALEARSRAAGNPECEIYREAKDAEKQEAEGR